MLEIYPNSLIRKSMPQSLLDRMAETQAADTKVKFDKGWEAIEAVDIFTKTQKAMYTNPEAIVRQGRYTEEEIKAYKQFGVMDVYKWQSKEYGDSHWSARSIRRFHDCARFYTHQEVEKFAILPFSHFDFAKRYGRPFALEILAISLTQMDDNHGRPPSVDWLEFRCGELGYDIGDFSEETAHLAGQLDEDRKNQVLRARFERVSRFLSGQAKKIVKDENKRELIQNLIERIQKILLDSLTEEDEAENENETDKNELVAERH